MKRIYLHPEISLVALETSSIIAASPDDRYSIGGEKSQYPESGGIKDDTGDGPGVSGAKQETPCEWDMEN